MIKMSPVLIITLEHDQVEELIVSDEQAIQAQYQDRQRRDQQEECSKAFCVFVFCITSRVQSSVWG
jgi:hypothetical protein